MFTSTHRIRILAVAFSYIFVALPGYALEGWTIDYELAQAEAQTSGKDILLNFTGSDWCPPCIFMHDKIFDTDIFRSSIPDEFILVELDFPNEAPQTIETKAQNAALVKKFNLDKTGSVAYPTILIVDSSGQPYAKTGFRNVSPQEYVDHLLELKAQRIARDAALDRASLAEGIERAKALDAAMQAMDMGVVVEYYDETIQEILHLDHENAAGLHTTYEAAFAEAELDAEVQKTIMMIRQGYLHDAVLRFDQLLAEYKPEGADKQMIIVMKGQTYIKMGDKAKAKKELQDAIDTVPDSPVVPQITKLIESLG